MSTNDKPVQRISKKNWIISLNKWRILVIMARLRMRFHTKYGFDYLKVVGECGYCIEVSSNCFECFLYEKRVCCSSECSKNNEEIERRNTPYLRYIREMRKDFPKGKEGQRRPIRVKIDWKKVISDALIMRNAIRGDRPY